MLDASDLLFYVHCKQKREDAQYSTKINFEINNLQKMIIETQLFIAKAEQIINKTIK
jgi:uncharacterized protein (UPF0332 family)